MTEKSPLRACDDIDEVVLNYAEIKGLAMKNPFMKEKMQVETEINKLNLLKGNWLDSKKKFKDKIESLPSKIEKLEKSIDNIKLDIEIYKNNKKTDFEITLNDIKFDDRAKVGEYLMQLKSKLEREKNANNIQYLGEYVGFKIGFTTTLETSKIYLIGNKTYEKELGISSIGNITRLENLANDIENELPIYKNRLAQTKKDLEYAKLEINKPFEQEERLSYLTNRKIKIDYNIENNITEEIDNDELLEFDDNKVIEISHSENYINKDNLSQNIYNQIYDFGSNVLDGKENYLVLNDNGFDRLVLEKINSDEYSLAHYSNLNGDAMRSPEITFKVIDKSVEITSYLDDYVAKYHSYEELRENTTLLKDIKYFFNDWLKNISEQFKIAIEKLKTLEKTEPKQPNIIKETNYIEEVIIENNVYDEKNMPIEKIRETYPKGTIIMLESVQGENMPKGLIGFVKGVDDKGQLQMLWQNGSSLAINISVDKFTVLGKENNNKENKEVEKEVDYEQDMEEI